MMTGTVCFKVKTAICNAKFRDVGDSGDRGVKIRGWKCHICNRRPWFAYLLCNFYGATMMIKGSLLLSVKHFRSKKKTVSFWAKIWRFWGINRGLKLNLSFMTPKRYIIALLSVVPARPAVSPSIDQEPSFVHRTSAAATSCQDCLPRLLFLQSWQEVWLVLCYVIYDFTFFELSRVKIHPRVWPVGWSKKKGINKTQKFDFLDL